MQCTRKCEWQIQAPWGNLALISWGNPLAKPVFLVHGREDCSATFEPLLELMPAEEFYYVAIDMPGSGNSDHFPNGVMLTRFHFVAAIDVAIQHLGWKKFIYLAHSMGADVGLFYNSVYPGKISKLVFLDPEPSLRRIQNGDLAEYQSKFYDAYYNNYLRNNYYFKTYTIPEATKALMKARSITEDKAAILVRRSLKHYKDDKYRFTWDRRLKIPAPQNYPNSYYFALFKSIPPALIVSAADSLNQKSQSGSLELLDNLCSLKCVKHVIVEGKHDVHLNNAERVAPLVIIFLRENTNEALSKL